MHLNLDALPEAVKEFFRSLPNTGEETVVEANGRPIARISTPVANPNGVSSDTDITPRNADRQVLPADDWERRLFGAAIECGVSVSDAALSSDGLYD